MTIKKKKKLLDDHLTLGKKRDNFIMVENIVDAVNLEKVMI